MIDDRLEAQWRSPRRRLARPSLGQLGAALWAEVRSLTIIFAQLPARDSRVFTLAISRARKSSGGFITLRRTASA